MERFSYCFILALSVMLFAALFPVSTEAEDSPEVVEEITEVKMEVIRKPKFCLRKAKAGDIILLKMEGKDLSTGKIFDTNMKEDQPYLFQYKGGHLDAEIEDSLNDMCAGEKRKIVIPGGGDRQNFTSKSGIEVSANATLEFIVELQDIQDSPDHVMVFNLLNTDKSGKLSVAQFMAIAAQGLAMFPTITTLEEMEVIVKEAFRLADKDGDGRLDLEEYLDSALVNKENAEHEEALQKKLADYREQEKAQKGEKAKQTQSKRNDEL